MSEKGGRVVLGVTGSIAAVKSPELVRQLSDKNYDVSCLLTKGAERFVTPLSLATFSGKPVISDMYGPEAYQMPHLRLASEADLLVVAPVTASVIARCAQGIADDMISLTYLTTLAPTLMAPAMHPTMWEHPATQQNVNILKSRGVTFIGPYQGPLADSTRGAGRMAEPEEIVQAIESLLSKRKRR